MVTLIAAPPAAPCSASNALVLTLTVWMASGDGTYADVDRQPRISVESRHPSACYWPATKRRSWNTVMARCGLPAAELASPVPAVVAAPGCNSRSDWKFLPSVPLYGNSDTSTARDL